MTLRPAEIVEMSDDEAQSLARDIIEVHGPAAAAIARDNARQAAVAAQIPQAKRWLKVLEFIQRQHLVKAPTGPRGPEFPSVPASET